MNRVLRKVGLVVLFALGLLTALMVLLATSHGVQTRVAQWYALRLSKQLGADVRIERLEFDPIRRLFLHGLLIHDQSGDTLLHAERAGLIAGGLHFRERRFEIASVELFRASFRLLQIDSAGTTNIDFLLDHFAGSPPDTARSGAAVVLTLESLELEDCTFWYKDPYAQGPVSLTGFNTDNIALTGINGAFLNLSFQDDTLRTRIVGLSAADKSGLELKSLEALATLHPNAIVLADMRMQTNQSSLQGYVALNHKDWSDYGYFTRKVLWEAEFEESHLHFSDLGYFSDELWDKQLGIQFSGRVSGPIYDIKGRGLRIGLGSRTIFRGNVDMLGLPNFENTFIELRVQQLSSDYEDLEHIRIGFAGAYTGPGLPQELARAGSLYFQGSFTGFPYDFVAFGNLQSSLGTLSLDLNVSSDDEVHRLYYTGNASTKGFDIGGLLDLEELGDVRAEVQVQAQSGAVFEQMLLDGKISALRYKDYTYSGIAVNGLLREQAFRGTLSCRDANLDFDFDGFVNFGADIPSFDFKALVHNFDLSALKLVELPQRFYFSSDMSLAGSGSGLADFYGTATARGTFLCYGDTTVFMEELVLSALGNENNRKVSLTSDFADAAITGVFQLDELYAGLHQMLSTTLPSIRTTDDAQFRTAQTYDFSVNYKAPNMVSGLFLPGLEIARNTTLYGSFDNSTGQIDALMRSSYLKYSDVAAHDLVLRASKLGESITVEFNADKAKAGIIPLDHTQLSIIAFDDVLRTKFGWYNLEQNTSGDIGFAAVLHEQDTYTFLIDSLRLTAKQSTWRLEQEARVEIDTDGIHMDSFELSNKDQRIKAAGTLGKREDQQANLVLQSIDLGYLDSLGIELDRHFKGIVNGEIMLSAAFEEPVITSQTHVRGFGVDDIAVGDITFNSSYQPSGKMLELEGYLTRSGFRVIDFQGSYAIAEEQPLNGKLTIDNLNLELVNIFDLQEVDQFSGRANGEITVKGTASAPQLKGAIQFDKARFRVDYLNVFFTFSDRLRVEEDWFGIDYKPILDEEGRQGFLVASAFHENFDKWSYDISAEVENFLVMNTDRSMNDLFYGRATATGFLQIGGFDDLLEISIDAQTGRGTSIKLPLDEPGDLTLENFVRFVNRQETQTGRQGSDLEGISMRLNIEATPESEIQLIFDERSGDIMRGRGKGIITLEIAPTGEFNMFGRYELVEGSYLFTLKSLINKQFTLRPGGTVSWYGDPYEAELNIDAIYNLRTPLYPIMIENRERYRRREEVNVVLRLSDKLTNPAVAFGVELPQSTDLERSQLESVLSTTQQLNQQVFALLILNHFLPAVDDGSGQGMGGLGSATTSEFLSTQISSWLSDISKDFDIGLNYRPGDQISNQEIAVALSTQLFNERVLLSGQFGVTTATEMQQNMGQSGLVGDFLLEYLITEDGKVRLKVFNETNPYEVFANAGSIYTQGVGLVFMEDFNNIGELLTKVSKIFSGETEIRPRPVQDPLP